MFYHRSLVSLALLLLATGACLNVRAAVDQPAPNLPAERLEFGSVTIYSENDKYFAGTDEHYTNGFKVSFLSTDLASFTGGPVPLSVQRLARTLGTLVPPGHAYKLGLSLGQNIYTPVNTATAAYQPNDRPYAAWLYAGVAFQVYAPPQPSARSLARLDAVEVTFGLVGPGALGKQVQNNFHHLIDVAPANGWSNQIHNELGLNLVFDRTYRIATQNARDGFGADFLPHVGISLGNIFTYANAGAQVRVGWRLPADFGTNLIRATGDSNSVRRPPWSVFGFGAVDGRVVAHDVTIEGNTFRSSAGVKRETWVGDLIGGIAVGTQRWQITYAQAVRSDEFKGQPKAAVFGSISITFFY
ncbi:MAG: lipid A deacylase LpxR family protein [Opitutaceae bacterium]